MADDNVSLFTYYTVMLGLASILLVDGWCKKLPKYLC